MKFKTKMFVISGASLLLLTGNALIGKKTVAYVVASLFRPDVMIHGPVLMADGIGRQSVELAQALSKTHRVHIKAKHIDKKDLPQSILDILRVKYKKSAPIAIIEDCLWFPGHTLDRFFPNTDAKNQIRYAYSMFESTQIRPEWVMMLNLYFDAVIVPDPFLIGVYRNSGVTIPIFHIPLGIDISDFLKAPLKKAKTKGPFVFASLGKAEDRKNHKLAMQAFAKVLGNNPNAILYVNCRAKELDFKEDLMQEVERLNCNNIKFTEVCLRKDAYLKFFQSIDCLLHFSKGEGFGIQPREAMALGVPVILSNNTTQKTICDSGLVKAVSSNIREPARYGNRIVGEFFNSDLEECAAAILDMYLHYDTYLEKGSEMRKWAAAYDYENMTAQYRSLVSPKEIVLADKNLITDKCIYTTSEALCRKYTQLDKHLKMQVAVSELPLDRIKGVNKDKIESYVQEFPLDNYKTFSTKNDEFYYVDALNDVIKTVICQGVSWESDLADLMKKYVQPGTTVLDIGAHIGTHTLGLSRAVGAKEGGRVIAFEPQPKIFRELFMNMKLNDVKNVDFLCAAVGDQEGEIELSPPVTNNEGGTDLIVGGTGEFVPLMTIDSLQLDHVSLMKIDVEKFEDQVLTGAKETIARCHPVIFIEIMGGFDVDKASPEIRSRIEHTIALLENMDYTLQRVGEADYIALPSHKANEPALL